MSYKQINLKEILRDAKDVPKYEILQKKFGKITYVMPFINTLLWLGCSSGTKILYQLSVNIWP